jgi:purine-binding chemotaxis protein CheW
LREQVFAVGLACVRRVVAAARPAALPGAPPGVLGVLDLQGEPVPVLDVAGLWPGPDDLQLDDRFLVIDTGQRVLALVTQEVQGVLRQAAQPLGGFSGLVADAEVARYQGVTRNGDGLVLIHDVERFLSAELARALDDALREHVAGKAGAEVVA